MASRVRVHRTGRDHGKSAATGVIRNHLPYVFHRGMVRVRCQLDTVLGRIYALWWGVEIGRAAEFYGLPMFYRHPTGRIEVGSRVTLRSAHWSNTIGINRRCYLSAGKGAHLSVGDDCGLSGTVIASSCEILLGNSVLCGANCTIVDTDRHPLDPAARARNGCAARSPVVIEDDVFLGMNVLVLKGSTIGKGTVVAANSVVTRSLPSGVVAGGVPAAPLKELS